MVLAFCGATEIITLSDLSWSHLSECDGVSANLAGQESRSLGADSDLHPKRWKDQDSNERSDEYSDLKGHTS